MVGFYSVFSIREREFPFQLKREIELFLCISSQRCIHLCCVNRKTVQSAADNHLSIFSIYGNYKTCYVYVGYSGYSVLFGT